MKSLDHTHTHTHTHTHIKRNNNKNDCDRTRFRLSNFTRIYALPEIYDCIRIFFFRKLFKIQNIIKYTLLYAFFFFSKNNHKKIIGCNKRIFFVFTERMPPIEQILGSDDDQKHFQFRTFFFLFLKMKN